MLSIAAISSNDPSHFNTFSRWEVVLYIRDVLREVPLPDCSLVDDLIAATGDSFADAAFVCALLCFSPPHTAQLQLQILLGYHAQLPPNAVEQSIHDIFNNLNAEISTQPKDAPLFNVMLSTVRSSPKLYEVHRLIALGCLRTMNDLLRFNICSIPSVYIGNNSSEVENLVQNAQQKGKITSALVYACTHWAYHASTAFPHDELIEHIILFLEKHALHWLEMLSVSGQNPLTVLSHLSKMRVSKH